MSAETRVWAIPLVIAVVYVIQERRVRRRELNDALESGMILWFLLGIYGAIVAGAV